MTSLSFAGAGWITPIHALAAAALGIEVVAFASRDRANAETKAQAVGGRAVAVDYADLPAGANLVVVATSPATHAGQAVHAVRAGASVIIETPFAATLSQADTIVELARDHQARVAYGENLVYSPIFSALLARRSTLGPLTYIEARIIDPPTLLANRSTDEWGGGALFDIGIHALAMATLLARPSRVKSVSARFERSASDATAGIDDAADVMLHFDSGLRAHIVASRRSTGGPTWDVQVAGESGVLRADIVPTPQLEHNGDIVRIPKPRLAHREVEDYGFLGQLGACSADFAAKREPVMDAEFGRFILDLTCAAYASAGADGTAMAVPFPGRRDRTPLQIWRDARATT